MMCIDCACPHTKCFVENSVDGVTIGCILRPGESDPAYDRDDSGKKLRNDE